MTSTDRRDTRTSPPARRARGNARRAWTTLVVVSIVLAAASGCASSRTLDRNKGVARMVFEDVLTQGKWEVFDRIHAPEFVAHAGGRSEGRAEDLESARGWRAAMPDLTVTVEQVIAEGDLVAVRWTGRGTNTGTGNGLQATGRRLEIPGITLFRIVRGRIVEEWNMIDELGLLRQLGAEPP